MKKERAGAPRRQIGAECASLSSIVAAHEVKSQIQCFWPHGKVTNSYISAIKLRLVGCQRVCLDVRLSIAVRLRTIEYSLLDQMTPGRWQFSQHIATIVCWIRTK